MLKKSFCAVALLAGMSTVASAQVAFEFSPTEIVMGTPTDITISATNTSSDAFNLGGAGWSFALGSGLSGGDYMWDTTTIDPSNANWDFTTSPRPELAWGGAKGDSPAVMSPGASLPLGTVQITGTSLGAYDLSLTDTFFIDDFFNDLSVQPGSGTASVNVVPEPATMMLMGVGGLMALRRRRK